MNNLTFLMLITPRTRTTVTLPTLDLEGETPPLLAGVTVEATHRIEDGWHMVFTAPSLRVARAMTHYVTDRGLDTSLYRIGHHEIEPVSCDDVSRDSVTEAGMGSFPASDPPSWTPVVGISRK